MPTEAPAQGSRALNPTEPTNIPVETTIDNAPADLEHAAEATEPLSERAPKKHKKSKATRAERLANQAAHFELVAEAATAVEAILWRNGLRCAVFGSLASRLYGASRCPKDVDMLVFEDTPPEGKEPLGQTELKDILLDAAPQHFYMTLPRDPEATYRLLHYRREYLGPSCKVDILTPGVMYLPHLPASSIHYFPPSPPLSFSSLHPATSPLPLLFSIRRAEGIPCVPFPLLLLHKLQGWDDHRLAEEAHKQRKQDQDQADVKRLTTLHEHTDKLTADAFTDPTLFPEEFVELTRRRVKDYCKAFPDRADRWREMGFVAEADLAAVEAGMENVALDEDEEKKLKGGETIEPTVTTMPDAASPPVSAVHPPDQDTRALEQQQPELVLESNILTFVADPDPEPQQTAPPQLTAAPPRPKRNHSRKKKTSMTTEEAPPTPQEPPKPTSKPRRRTAPPKTTAAPTQTELPQPPTSAPRRRRPKASSAPASRSTKDPVAAVEIMEPMRAGIAILESNILMF